MRKVNPRKARRMMQRMGLSMDSIDVELVVFRTSNKEIIIENPEVSILEMQGQKIFQVVGGQMTEKMIEKELLIPEADVQLVAQQANVSFERAQAILKETKGDLAQAILLLTQG